MGVELDGVELVDVLLVPITGVDIAEIDGVVVAEIEADDGKDNESLRPID
jgi:hypothetical protein